jgi:hypothetical protein
VFQKSRPDPGDHSSTVFRGVPDYEHQEIRSAQPGATDNLGDAETLREDFSF